jgi:DNA-binding response OmpR family regulator
MRRVLVIDDQPDISETIAATLSIVARWEVLTANTGEEGVRLAAEQSPDCILLDVMMPDLDGPATLRRLKSNSQTARVPVIFLTSKAQISEQEELGRIGAAGVLTKPFDPLQLGQQISNILGWSE